MLYRAAMNSPELRAIMEADEKATRLSSLRDLLVSTLALLGGALGLATIWPTRFSAVQHVSVWLFGAGGLATLLLTTRAYSWARRRDQLMGVQESD